MNRFFHVLAVSSVLVLSTACFEIERHVALKADGSATVRDHFALSDSLLSILKQINEIDPSEDITEDSPEFADAATLAALEDKGVKVKSFEHQFDHEKFFFDFEIELASFSAVQYTAPVTPLEEDDEQVPLPLSLTQVEPGVYKLSLTAESPPTNEAEDMAGGEEPAPAPADAPPAEGSATEAPADGAAATAEGAEAPAEVKAEEPSDPPAAAPEEPEKELTPEEQQKMMELTMEMMGTLKDLALVQSITVPGKIVDYGPKYGKKKKATVTWTQDVKDMQAAMESGKLDDGVRWVTFTKVELPESALYAP